MGMPKLSKNAWNRTREQNMLCLKHFLSSRRWLSATGSCKCTARLQEFDENEPALKALRERMPQNKLFANMYMNIPALFSLVWPQLLEKPRSHRLALTCTEHERGQEGFVRGGSFGPLNTA